MPLADFVWAPMVYAYTYAVWWVVVAGLLIEGIVYFIAWRKGFWRTVSLTLSVNITSAIAAQLSPSPVRSSSIRRPRS